MGCAWEAPTRASAAAPQQQQQQDGLVSELERYAAARARCDAACRLGVDDEVSVVLRARYTHISLSHTSGLP